MLSLKAVENLNNKKNARRCNGLAPVVCYDPWIPRIFETIKQSVLDKIPVLVRLHCAADYPITGEKRYSNDIESHAVLIAGYDDATESFLVIDPWNRQWGGIYGGTRWLKYSDLTMLMVDASKGMATPLSSLQVSEIKVVKNGPNTSLKFSVGYYNPRGTVMDRDNTEIVEISAACTLPPSWGGEIYERTITGSWKIGYYAEVILPIKCDLTGMEDVNLRICAKLQGTRPYPFIDSVSMMLDQTIHANRQNVVTAEGEEMVL